MKELEEVNCEIQRVIDLQHLISDRLNNAEDNDYGLSLHMQDYDASKNPLGGFLHGTTYAWMSHGCHLIVLNVKSGESVNCCWTFRERITCVTEFPTQPGQLPLLLVGLDNGSNRIKDSMGLLCIFDCNTSRVLRAIRTPAGVERVCIVSGGSEWEEINDKRTDNIFSDMDGIACVVLRNLQHVMIDLQRSLWDDPNCITYMDEASPAELDFSLRKYPNDKSHCTKGKHTAYNLLSSSIEKYIGFNRTEFESSSLMSDNLIPTIICSTKIGCLISGCLGRVIIWQNNGSVGWISRPVEENMVITHLSLLEPTDDPRPFYYLWVVYQDESSKTPPVLRMYALLFERKYCNKGTSLYFNLEAEPCLRFEFELEKGDRIISLSPIEREANPDQTDSNTKRGEDNLLLIATNERILLFDLNQWYKEQMPHTIYDCKNPNSILATYRTSLDAPHTGDKLLSCSYVPFTLREFATNNPCPAEELFYPNSLSFEWVELSTTQLVFWMTRGIQAELLRRMAITGPIILLQPMETFHKCLSVGLVPFNTELSFASDENIQREVLLSLCLEQRWTSFLVKCAREWSDGSASYLYPSFLKWGIQRASSIKTIADRLCIPLFDQSDSSIGEAEIKTLRFCSQQLECLSNVVSNLMLDTDDMIRQHRALKHVSTYLQVLLWFYDVGLLPEIQELDEEGQLPVSLSFRIPYPYEKLMSVYTQKRNAIKVNKSSLEEDEGLFIDILINKECPILISQWERESGNVSTGGYYPPPSLQSLLRSYLTDCHQTQINETECKHQITIYLLMDLAMLLQGSYPGVDQLIKYPSAFKMSPSLIKLTQAFWLLDHDDYQGFLDMMTGQLVLDSDVKSWHHKLVLRTLVRNNQQKLALTYLRIRKPPISSTDDQSTIVNLSVQHGLVQSAFHCRPPSHYIQLLMCFFEACKLYNKLGDILHLALEPEEEEVFVKFLQEDTSGDIKTLYYLQRCRYAELDNKNVLSQFKNNIPKNMLPTSVAMLTAYDATLPGITKQFSSGMIKTNLETDLESKYPRPMSHYKCINKQQSIYETVIRKAKETSFQSRKCRIPFVTAPCASLRTNENSINISCVLFPTRAHTNCNKRTLDDIYDSEDNSNVILEEIKRRKLSNSGNTTNTSCHNNLNVTLDTPLVKRKNNISNHKGTSIGTPHSILKIRQLIQNSASPNISIAHSVDTEDKEISLEKEKKVNRQIRFNISNSRKNIIVTHDDINDEEEDMNKDTSLTKDMSYTKDTSEEGTDVFQSPNASVKSQNETTMLLSDNSYSDISNYCPRPRPSLRRTYVLGKNASSIINSTNLSASSSDLLNTSKDAITCAEETNKQTCSTSPSRSTLHNSSSATMYSTMILSPTSSFERSPSVEKIEKSNLSDQLASSTKMGNYKNTISSTPLTKYKITEAVNDNNEEMTLVKYANESLTEDFKKDEQMEARDDDNATLKKNNMLEKTKENKYNEEKQYEFRSLSESFEHEFHPTNSEVNKDHIENYNKSSNGIQKSLKLTSNFDITDDESSNDSNEIRLMLDKSDEDKNDYMDPITDSTNIVSQPIQHFSDVSNITEDKSNNSNDIKEFEVRNLKQIGKVNELKKFGGTDINRKDSSNDLISRELSSQQIVTNQDVSKNEVQSCNKVATCVVKLHKISTEVKETITLEESTSEIISEGTKRSKRINTVKKQTASIKRISENMSHETLDNSENVMSAPALRRTRSSSVAKDTFPIIIDDHESEIAEDKESNRRNMRRAISVQKEITRVSTPISKRTRSASISNITDKESNDVSLIKSKSSGRKTSATKKEEEEEKPLGGRLTKGSSTSLITQDNTEHEEKINIQTRRRRGNSVPKEPSVPKITRKERASSVIPDIPEEPTTPIAESRRRRSSISSKIIEEVTDSPAANTRSRRSSIQSIPEELEHILNSPVSRKSQHLIETKESLTNTRTRRATSVDSPSVDLKKRSRNLRARSIIKDPILEESIEMESHGSLGATKNATEVSSKRKRTTSITENKTEEQEDTKEKPKKGRQKLTASNKKEQFSFSQPEKMEVQPNEASVSEVPNYIFSPPQTRSRNSSLKEISRIKHSK
ncbi:hypothetical protein KPH14_010052 [Odynerus spinipes]|uniref:ELYS-like domain-containing protein n=1 Tax=Odynerus spinipes TaxID=1348599 RepID=A0AAD9VTB6_9HYME|nr:hypothetical protein KPH14_010052 [Odynerus spinipes]